MITVALVGCGNIAVGYDISPRKAKHNGALSHLSAINQVGGFDVVACIDPNTEALDRAGSLLPSTQLYSSLSNLQRSSIAFDLVVIASPTELHDEHFRFAIANGAKAIFCEKPLSTTSESSIQLLTLAMKNDVEVATNYLRLWDRELIKLGRKIRSGKFGELQSASGWYTKGLRHNGPHMTVLLADLLGEITPCKEVTKALSMGLPREISVLSHGNARILLHGLDHQYYNEFELELNFTQAIIRLEDGTRRICIRYPCDHPDYSGMSYPEKLVKYSSQQEMALIYAWQEWKSFFHNGFKFRRDALWCANQERIAITLADWQKNIL